MREMLHYINAREITTIVRHKNIQPDNDIRALELYTIPRSAGVHEPNLMDCPAH